MVLRSSTFKTRIPNTFLRKRRKWPHSPYKTHWHYTFSQQEALQTLKKSSIESPQIPIPQHFLLNCLINSFKSYDCDPSPNAYQFVIKTLIQNSHFDELNHVLTHLQKVDKLETPERILVDLIRVYGEKGMIHEAIDLFFRIPSFRCVATVNSLNSLLLILCRNKEFLSFVPEVLVRSRAMDIRAEESSFSILITSLCRIGRVDYAIKLLNYMVDDGFYPNHKICSFILSCLCQQKGVISFEVMDILEGMRKIGFCLGRGNFRDLIRLLVKQGKGKDAFDVLCDMKREGIKPDIACYEMVLRGLIEEGLFSRAEELFDEILVFGLVPNVRTYNTYINGLCKQEKLDVAYSMISCMQEVGCQPDLVTYKTVLESFSRFEKLGRLREIWKEMKLKGIEIDIQTYGIMIDALVVVGEVIDACNLLEEMLCYNSTLTSTALDDIICRLEKHYSRGIDPGSRAWEALLLGLNLNLSYETVVLANLVNLHED